MLIRCVFFTTLLVSIPTAVARGIVYRGLPCNIFQGRWLGKVGSSSITGGHCTQNQLWCANIREYIAFGSIVGSDYHAAPRSDEEPLLIEDVGAPLKAARVL